MSGNATLVMVEDRMAAMVPTITVQVAHHLYGRAETGGELLGGDPQDGRPRAGSGPRAHHPPPEARNRLTAARAASVSGARQVVLGGEQLAVGVEHVGQRDQPALVGLLRNRRERASGP